MTLRTTLTRLSIALACGFAATTWAQTQPAPAAPPATDAKARVAVEAAFTKADANGDGKLSREEVAKVPSVAAKFDSLDKDKDGSLSMTEFTAGYSAS